MIQTTTERKIRCYPGTIVTVRSRSEIASTLDSRGRLDGLPFLPEMWKYCGQTLEVAARLDRMMVEGVGFRRVEDMVLLKGAVCDGSSHNGCVRLCNLLFKEDWLRPADADAAPQDSDDPQVDVFSDPNVCQGQSPVLVEASRPLPLLISAEYWTLKHTRASIRWLRNRTASLAHQCQSLAARDMEDSGEVFQAGDIAEVRSKEEIMATLDEKGENRRLKFSAQMFKFCGNRYKVLACPGTFVDEKTGNSLNLRKTVILEGTTCHHEWCPRQCYWLWRDVWLKKIDVDR